MYFDSVADVIAMGTHGVFVWSAYAFSAVLIVTSMVLAVRQQRVVKQDIARQMRREDVNQRGQS